MVRRRLYRKGTTSLVLLGLIGPACATNEAEIGRTTVRSIAAAEAKLSSVELQGTCDIVQVTVPPASGLADTKSVAPADPVPAPNSTNRFGRRQKGDMSFALTGKLWRWEAPDLNRGRRQVYMCDGKNVYDFRSGPDLKGYQDTGVFGSDLPWDCWPLSFAYRVGSRMSLLGSKGSLSALLSQVTVRKAVVHGNHTDLEGDLQWTDNCLVFGSKGKGPVLAFKASLRSDMDYLPESMSFTYDCSGFSERWNLVCKGYRRIGGLAIPRSFRYAHEERTDGNLFLLLRSDYEFQKVRANDPSIRVQTSLPPGHRFYGTGRVDVAYVVDSEGKSLREVPYDFGAAAAAARRAALKNIAFVVVGGTLVVLALRKLGVRPKMFSKRC